MGTKSTMDITRSDCLAEIQERLQYATNAALASVLYILVEFGAEDYADRLENHNFNIVPDYSGSWHIKYNKVED